MSNLLPVALWLALSIGQGTTGTADQRPANPGQVDEGLPAYYFLLGRYYEGENKIDDAVASFKKAIELDPRSAELRAELAALYARADKPREAVEAAEDALKVDPKNKEANRILGSVLAALAEQKQKLRPADDVNTYAARATAALEIARGEGSGDLSIDLALARLYLDGDRPGDAIPLLRRIVIEQPQYAEGSILLAEAQEATGAADAAIDTLTGLLADQPQLFRARVQLAELYDHERKWTEAAEAWAAVQKLNQRNTEIAARRGAALLNAGRPAEAGTVLRDALKLAPNDVRMSFMLAQAQRDAGDVEAAEKTARALQAAHPEDARTTYLLAQMLASQGHHQDVVDLLKPEIARLRTANAKPGQIALLLGAEGLSMLQLKRHDEAMALYKEAIALAPDDTSVQFQYGAALDRAGKQADAQKIFRDLIARDPLDANALNYLGYMMAERATALDEAIALIQRALKIDPDNPSYQDSLGWAYVQQGKLDLADAPLTDAARRLPKDSVVQEHLGDLRLKQNRRAEAVEAWERALAGDGEGIDRAKVQKKIETAKKSRQ